MAYTETKKPAFYVPYFDYMQSTGLITYPDLGDLSDVHLLDPSKTHRFNTADVNQIDINFEKALPYSWIQDEDGYVYIFVLGHNLHSAGASLSLSLIGDDDTVVTTDDVYEVVNYNGDTAPNYNGFSVYKAGFVADSIKTFRITISVDADADIKLGCVSLCSKWTPPHTPDLSMSMVREFDGIKNKQTKGGATISNAQYKRNGTYWATSNAWELTTGDYEPEEPEVKASRTLGRRNWEMNFSYLDPGNLMPEVESLNWYESDSYSANSGITIQENTTSFFSRVLNRVQGEHLPFIFQPDSTNTNPDQWAMVRFDQDDFKLSQVAPSLYSMGMKIRESW